MDNLNILEAIDLDKWIYAGYLTSYRDFFQWRGPEPPPIRKEKKLKAKICPEDIEKFKQQWTIKKPCHQGCRCRKFCPKPEPAVVSKDYLKGFKTTYEDNFNMKPFSEQTRNTDMTPCKDPLEAYRKTVRDIIEGKNVKLTDAEEDIIKKNYLYRQKIKIMRKRPVQLEE